MLLSDGTIMGLLAKGDIAITPMPKGVQIQPCSIDLRLGMSFRPLEGPGVLSDRYLLRPGEFVLACTAERVTVGASFVGQVHGRSTWARRGLQIHAAGLIDPGFSGDITLELVNMGPLPLPLLAGKRICQITFERLDWPAARPYGHQELQSHYQHQMGATLSAKDASA